MATKAGRTRATPSRSRMDTTVPWADGTSTANSRWAAAFAIRPAQRSIFRLAPYCRGPGTVVAGRSMDLAAVAKNIPCRRRMRSSRRRQHCFRGRTISGAASRPWGADCSGMLQSIFALHGVHLLRDAWQQATQGVAVEGGLEAMKPADLLFFREHEDGPHHSRRDVHRQLAGGAYRARTRRTLQSSRSTAPTTTRAD